VSEIKVNSIKGVGASAAAITVNNSDGTCTANLSNRQAKNLIHNGDMRIAQRGTSSTTTGYQTVDRIALVYNGNDSITQAQVDVASGTTPYSLGFRKAFKATNGNQVSLGSTQLMEFRHRIEAQDIASSGWNYTDPNSFITLSFWVKSSVSFNMKGYFFTQDNSYNYPLETGTLSANTWTKITKTISGNSNLVFNNDNGHGITISFGVYGPFFSSASPSVNQWVAYSSATLTNPSETSWWTTNGATLEFTGLQLEVGSVATDFEHRSFAQELQLCKRYFQIIGPSSGEAQNSSNIQGTLQATPFMRANPSIAIIDNSNNVGLAGAGTNSVTSVGTIYTESESLGMGGWVEMGGSGFTQHRFYHIYGGKFSFSAEL